MIHAGRRRWDTLGDKGADIKEGVTVVTVGLVCLILDLSDVVRACGYADRRSLYWSLWVELVSVRQTLVYLSRCP